MKNLDSIEKLDKFKNTSVQQDKKSETVVTDNHSFNKQSTADDAGKFSFDWKNSFSKVKRNFFKFNLETTLIALVLISVGINTFAEGHKFQPGQNRYLAYLISNPELNSNIVDNLEMENISIVPEKLNFVLAAQAATLDSMIGVDPILTEAGREKSESSTAFSSEDSVIVKPNLATIDANSRRDVREYVVLNGDSISRIASQFGVSVQTVLYENGLTETDYIKPGQTLSILPTTGIKHTVKDGETLGAIANKYEVGLEAILEFNEIEVPDDILAGEVIIIPEGKIEVSQTAIASYNRVEIETASAPEDFAAATGNLIWPLPTRQVTQYYSSRHRALDISNSQRPQFWSSQDGIVELSGWQGGYGNTIIVNHGNGLKTRYAHASELYVSAGDAVTKGQVIGRVGNTGRTYGLTGNHLHYEVTKNGVKVDPLGYVK